MEKGTQREGDEANSRSTTLLPAQPRETLWANTILTDLTDFSVLFGNHISSAEMYFQRSECVRRTRITIETTLQQQSDSSPLELRRQKCAQIFAKINPFGVMENGDSFCYSKNDQNMFSHSAFQVMNFSFGIKRSHTIAYQMHFIFLGTETFQFKFDLNTTEIYMPCGGIYSRTRECAGCSCNNASFYSVPSKVQQITEKWVHSSKQKHIVWSGQWIYGLLNRQRIRAANSEISKKTKFFRFMFAFNRTWILSNKEIVIRAKKARRHRWRPRHYMTKAPPQRPTY